MNMSSLINILTLISVISVPICVFSIFTSIQLFHLLIHGAGRCFALSLPLPMPAVGRLGSNGAGCLGSSWDSVGGVCSDYVKV